MNNKTKLTIMSYAGVTIVLLWLGFQGSMPFTVIAVILTAVIVLHFVIPSKYNRNFFVFELLFMTGYLIGVEAERFLGEIPSWTAWVWLASCVAISVLWPFPFLKDPDGWH